MAEYSPFKLTNAGLDLRVRCAALGETLEFLHIQLGNGSWVYPESVPAMVALDNPMKVQPIDEVKQLSDTEYRIKAYIVDEDLPTTGFDMREIGIWAQTQEQAEPVLFGVVYAGNNCDHLPGVGDAVAYDYLINIVVTTGSPDIAVVTVSNAGVVGRDDFGDHVELIVDPTKTGGDKKHVTDTQAKKWEDHADDPHDYAPSSHMDAVADPTETGSDKKHVTDTQAKKWEDHADDPHDYAPSYHMDAVVDPTKTGSDKKHVTDTQAKKWEDHADDPHDYAPSDHEHIVVSESIISTGQNIFRLEDIRVSTGNLTVHYYEPDAGGEAALELLNCFPCDLEGEVVDDTPTRYVNTVKTIPAGMVVRVSSVSGAVQSLGDITIIATDGYRKAVETASGGRNTVIYDDQGNPNVMVVIPRFNVDDLGLPDLDLGTGTHPAFKTNGTDRGEILVGKYTACNAMNGCAVLGGQYPKVSINYDNAKAMCVAKGAGWHLMSIHEWAAIALWSLANDTVPRGNTLYGQSHSVPHETCLRLDGGMPGDSAGSPVGACGSGPVTWSHDHTPLGVMDLVGNVWEWLDQMMLEDGQIITTDDNNPSLEEDDWTRHAAFLDSISDAQTDSCGPPRLAPSVTNYNGPTGSNGSFGYNYLNPIGALIKDASYTPNELLRQLLIESATTATAIGAIYSRNYGTRFPIRGGSWGNGSGAGLGAVNVCNARSDASGSIGFRPAFFAN